MLLTLSANAARHPSTTIPKRRERIETVTGSSVLNPCLNRKNPCVRLVEQCCQVKLKRKKQPRANPMESVVLRERPRKHQAIFQQCRIEQQPGQDSWVTRVEPAPEMQFLKNSDDRSRPVSGQVQAGYASPFGQHLVYSYHFAYTNIVVLGI